MARAISERTVEVPWILETIQHIKPETLLDVGFAGGWYLQQLINMGIKCTGLDADVDRISGKAFLIGEKEKTEWRELARHIKHMIKDITKYPATNEPHPTFPIVICVSTIEHIVPCGYQNDCYRDLEADMRAVANMKKLVTKDGSLILTFPCGQEKFFYNQSRNRTTSFDDKVFTAGKYDMIVYGSNRFERLIGDWRVMDQQFWTRQDGETGNFTQCDSEVAFAKVPSVEIPVQSVCAVRMVSS